MKNISPFILITVLLFCSIREVNAQDDKQKHFRFVSVENFPGKALVVFGISDDGLKFEELKVNKTTSSSGTDFNEAIKLIQKFQGEGWALTRIQHIDLYKAFLIFEK